MIYREWVFTDITLTPAEEQRTRKQFQEMFDKGSTGGMLDRLRAKPPSKYEKQLSREYHKAETPEDRIAVLEYWMLGLYRAYAEMTRFEQKNFGYRLKALRQLAQALIDRDLRAIELRHHEQRVAAQTAPTTKINIKTVTGEIVRIHEAMRTAGIYADETEVSRIVAMYHVETALKDVETSYRSAPNKAEVHLTSSRKFFRVVEILSDQLSPAQREKLAIHCAKPAKKNGT